MTFILLTSQATMVIPGIEIILMNKDSNQGGRVIQNCLQMDTQYLLRNMVMKTGSL